MEKAKAKDATLSVFIQDVISYLKKYSRSLGISRIYESCEGCLSFDIWDGSVRFEFEEEGPDEYLIDRILVFGSGLGGDSQVDLHEELERELEGTIWHNKGKFNAKVLANDISNVIDTVTNRLIEQDNASLKRKAVGHPPTITDIQNIIGGRRAEKFLWPDGRSIVVDLMTANALNTIYDNLSSSNQKKFEDQMGSSYKMFRKLVDFAYSKVKLGELQQKVHGK